MHTLSKKNVLLHTLFNKMSILYHCVPKIHIKLHSHDGLFLFETFLFFMTFENFLNLALLFC